MKVIICGAGQVGWQIARHLSSEKNDVTVVDNNSDLVARAVDTLDVNGIAGNASYPDVLSMAGAADADMIIAATYSDEVNMVTCQVAHSVFKIPRKIARLRGQSYLDAIYSDLYQRDHLPIDVVISPEKEVAIQALRQLRSPATFDTEPFMEGKAELLGLILTEECNVLNTPLRQLSEIFPNLRANVVAIRRNGLLLVPDSQEQLFLNDQVYVCTNSDDKDRCLELFGKANKKQDRVIIIGGGNIGKYVAKNLELNNKNINIKLIESNKDRAEKAAKELTSTLVINGDVLDRNIMIEAGVDNADTFIALTNEENINLLSSVMAKELGSKQTLSLLIDKNYINLQSKLEIDKFINPRETTISSILRYLRKGRIRDAHSLCGGDAEIIEAEVLETSPLLGKFIKDSELPNNVRIGAILRGGIVIKPNGSTKIELHDRVVIFCLSALDLESF